MRLCGLSLIIGIKHENIKVGNIIVACFRYGEGVLISCGKCIEIKPEVSITPIKRYHFSSDGSISDFPKTINCGDTSMLTRSWVLLKQPVVNIVGLFKVCSGSSVNINYIRDEIGRILERRNREGKV